MRRACRYRQNKSDEWRSGWLLGWAGLSEYPQAIIETEEGEVVLMSIRQSLPIDYHADHKGYIRFTDKDVEEGKNNA